MKKIHPQMERLYAAARETGRLDERIAPTSLASLLNVSQQNVGNWESRGPSEKGLLCAQQVLGINAVWVQTGVGQMFINTPVATSVEWPFKSIPPATYWALGEYDRGVVEGFVKNVVAASMVVADKSKAG